MLLASRLSLIIAASSIALQLPPHHAGDQLGAGAGRGGDLYALADPLLAPAAWAQEVVERTGVVLLGTDSLAELLGTRLAQSGERVTFVGRDDARLQRLERGGFSVVRGSPDDPEVLRQAGAERARAFIAVSSDPGGGAAGGRAPPRCASGSRR